MMDHLAAIVNGISLLTIVAKLSHWNVTGCPESSSVREDFLLRVNGKIALQLPPTSHTNELGFLL